MKKNIIKSIFVLAVIGIAFLNINKGNNKSNSDQSLLSLNQDALAYPCETYGSHGSNYEVYSIGGCVWFCFPNGNYGCPNY